MVGTLLNMPWKIRFEILIFPCGVSTNPSAPHQPRSFTILRLLRAALFVSFSRQVPRTGEKIRSGLRLNACVSIVKLADMADSIVLNFYLMYPILRGSLVFLRLSSFRLFVVSSSSSSSSSSPSTSLLRASDIWSLDEIFDEIPLAFKLYAFNALTRRDTIAHLKLSSFFLYIEAGCGSFKPRELPASRAKT